ncbi:MAG: N-acetylneuraminate synthase family protein [Pseudobutyrivibrio sp.]|nr:N-acetylneuraminate synthase family protein [Pseudobutyrivibrio sp.]
MKFSEVKEYGQAYVIAEIGANHNGDVELAKKMIDIAKECGADCVKFQSWTKDSIFSRKVYNDNYFLRDDYRNRTDYTLESIVDAYAIDKAQHKELKEYCDKVGIEFASTPFSKAEVDMLVDELDVPFIKIASMDLNNVPFLKYCAKKGKPVVMSTGLCSLADVSVAVDTLKENGCDDIYLLHCVSIYPPADEQVNLNNIDMLRTAFELPTGYSDHTLGALAPIMSVTKGVCIIEKHFTLDKNMVGWDHKVSADPEDLKAICEAAQRGYKMLGSTKKVVNEDQERRDAFQRSIVAARPIKKGEIITEDDIDYKRPGTGISPKYYEFVIGKEAKRDLEYDEIIQMGDF